MQTKGNKHLNLFSIVIFRSDRYRCLNNIPDHRSDSFVRLNNEKAARELPGSFSDLNDQCRRAFGVDFEYCQVLIHGVSICFFY